MIKKINMRLRTHIYTFLVFTF